MLLLASISLCVVRSVCDRLLENAASIVNLITTDLSSRIYLCGDGGDMAAGVTKALEAAFVEHGGFAHEDAIGRVKQLVVEGRFLKDVWFWG